MIRLRVSTVEEYRYCVQSEDRDEEELVQRIIRGQWMEGKPNWMMRAGTCLHNLMSSREPRVERYGYPAQPQEYIFRGDDVLTIRKLCQGGLREVLGRKVYEIGGRPVQVEGTCDWISGATIRDHKTKFSAPNARDYEHSLQWRFYLDLFDADRFQYLLHAMTDPDETGLCLLKQTVTFHFWRYPQMQDDLARWLSLFLDFCHARKLMPYLKQKRAVA